MATTPSESKRRSQSHERAYEASPDVLTSQTAAHTPPQFDLLDDTATQEILTALCDGPKRGRELVRLCEASRATIYRRVDRLDSIGLLTADVTSDSSGPRCKEFRLVRDRLRVTIDGGTISLAVDSTTL